LDNVINRAPTLLVSEDEVAAEEGRAAVTEESTFQYPAVEHALVVTTSRHHPGKEELKLQT
jgi:hypothetical protein